MENILDFHSKGRIAYASHGVLKEKMKMQYMVQMTLVAPGRPTIADDGPTFIEEYILPTLELCQQMQSEKRIIGGGPMSGAVGLVLLVQADSAKELDDLITSMPVWPRMETQVTPLTTFGERALTVRSKLEQLKAQTKKAA